MTAIKSICIVILCFCIGAILVAATPIFIIIGTGLGILVAAYFTYFLMKYDPEKDDPFGDNDAKEPRQD